MRVNIASLARRSALGIAALFGSVALASAQPSADAPAAFDIRNVDHESYRARATRLPQGQAPKVDGHLDDEVWQLAEPQGNFIQREPKYGQPSTEKTEFRLLYDDKKIYLAVWLWDSDPRSILASELKRDSGLRKGDQLKINFDTFHDHRNAFYFSTNPLGALKDANSVENGRTINYDWNAVWENRTSIDDKGWYVEAAIPLSQLRFPAIVGEELWGLNLCRIIFRKNEEAYWVPFPREWGASGFAHVSNAGVLEGLQNLKARRRVEFVPYILPTASRDYLLQDKTETDAKFGGDFKIGVTNDLTADFTYHTDFAQVEADQEVVNLTRFSLFFPEKRQFFTEGAGIFDYGKNSSGLGGEAATNDPGMLALFYSRKIGLVDGQEVPIVGGGRLTGRVGDYAVGVLNVTTEDSTVRRNGTTLAAPGANFTAIRVKRNILAKSTVGALFLNSDKGVSAFNRSVGVDMGLAFGASTQIIGLLAATQSPDALGGGGAARNTAGVLDFSYKTDKYSYNAQYQDVGERFNAEMGFIPRLDIRAYKTKAGYTPRPRWRGVRQLVMNGGIEYYEDHTGRVDSKTTSFDVQMQRQDSSGAKVTVKREFDDLTLPFATAGTTLAPAPYSWTTAQFNYTSNNTKRVFGSATADAGGYYNGTRRSLQLNLNFLVGKTLLLEPNYTRNHVQLPGRPLYTSNVMNFRVSHSFSPDLFWKGFVQYNDDRRTASFNFLFWYIYKPGSDLYVVFNQGWDANLPVPDHYNVRNRSLAVKMTYWLAR